MARASIGFDGKVVRTYIGLLTDAKPTENIGGGSKYRERDTGKEWVYDAEDGWLLTTSAAKKSTKTKSKTA